MKDHPPIKPLDTRPRIQGWCPGDYMTSCIICKSLFTGDKRSYNCADCAYQKEDSFIKIKVWRVYLNGQIYYTSNDSILMDSIKTFISDSSSNQNLKITHDTMNEADYNKLQEFDGY